MKSTRTPGGTARKQTPPATAASAARRDEERAACIAVAAYYKAEARGFEPGHELEDWLSAEAEAK